MKIIHIINHKTGDLTFRALVNDSGKHAIQQQYFNRYGQECWKYLTRDDPEWKIFFESIEKEVDNTPSM